MAVKVKTKNVVDYIDFYGIKYKGLGSLGELVYTDELFLHTRGNFYGEAVNLFVSEHGGDIERYDSVLLDVITIESNKECELAEKMEFLLK